MRMGVLLAYLLSSHLYGQGFPGDEPGGPSREQIEEANRAMAGLGGRYAGQHRDPERKKPTVHLYDLPTDTSFQKLPDLPFCFGLQIRNSQDGVTPIRELAKLKNLVWLNVLGGDVQLDGVNWAEDFKKLNDLSLGFTKMDDGKFQQVAKFKGLQGLRIFGNLGKATAKGMEAISQLENLEEIGLYLIPEVSGGVLRALGKLKRLQRVEINGGSGITDEGFKELLHLENLARLKVLTEGISLAGCENITRLKRLTILEIGSPQVDDAGVRLIGKLSNLTELKLTGKKITDAGAQEIGQLKNLTKLNLAHTGITDQGLKDIALLENLTHLDLSGTGITDAGLMEIAKLKKLKFLDLGQTRVTPVGKGELRKAFPKLGI